MTPSQDILVAKTSALSFDRSTMLTVRVGTETGRQEFVVNEDLLTSRSEFFRCAMNGNWKTSKERVVMLEETDPNLFRLWLNVIYTQSFPIKGAKDYEELTDAQFVDQIAAEYGALVSIYVLCEMLLDEKSKDGVITAIFTIASILWKTQRYVPPYDVVKLAYDGTPETSPLRRLLADLYSTINRNYLGRQHLDDLPKEFYRDLVLALPNAKENVAIQNGPSKYFSQTNEKQYIAHRTFYRQA